MREIHLILTFAILALLAFACGGDQTPEASPPATSTLVAEITSTPPSQPKITPTPTFISPLPTPTPQPTITPAPTLRPTAAPMPFIDSGQRLGSAHSQDVSLGDLDGDGDLDAFVTNWNQASEVWLNDGQGIFTVSEQNLGSGVGIALGDLDGDGDLDAFLANWDQDTQVWFNDGTAVFSEGGQGLDSGRAFAAALGDLDSDGDLDAFVARDQANIVWLNDGEGIFADTGQALGYAITADVVLGDLDSDGDLDALAGGWDEPAKVWLNDGAGNFTESDRDLCPASVHIHGIALGDVDNDGDLDAFLALASGDPNQVWLNDGSGAFSDSGQRLLSPLAHDVALGDLDGDGDLDALTAHGDRRRGSGGKIWLNDGNGRFSDSSSSLGDAYSTAVGLADVDADNDLDAFITHGALWGGSGSGQPNQVWINATP